MPVWAKNILPWLLKVWPWVKKILIYIANLLVLTLVYLLVEYLGGLLLYPDNANCLNFGLCWSMILATICLMLPRLAGRIFFGITYYAALLWTLAQAAYNSVFSRMMWLTDVAYAGEGAGYAGGITSAAVDGIKCAEALIKNHL